MADVTINLAVAGTEVVTGALRRVGEVAIDALGAAFKVVGDFAADSFKGALEAQAGIDTFNAALTRAGKNAPITADAAMELSQSLKNLTGGSDDTILAMETIGLRFDKIGKDTFPRFIESSADLAATLHMGPEQAAQLLGKTLQDLSTDGTASIGRLRAAGVTLTDDQEKLIAKLVETGDAAGAQKVLLDALAETTGGAAATAAGTFAGQMAIFQETVADAGEGVMMALLPSLTQLAMEVLPQLTPVIATVAAAATTFITGQLIPAFQQAVAWLQENWPAIQATIADVWAQAQPILQAIWDFIQGTVIPAFQTAVDWVITNWPMIQATIAQVMADVRAGLETVLTAIQTFWATWGDDIMAVIDNMVAVITDVVSAFQKAFKGDWEGFGEDLRKAWDKVWADVQAIVKGAVDWFSTQDWGAIGTSILQGIAAGITGATQFVIDAATAAAQAAVAAVKGFLGIQSPSVVFRGIGENTMAGLAQGIAGASYMPAQAAAGAAQQTAQSTVNNMGGNTYNYYGVSADMNAAYTRALAGAF